MSNQILDSNDLINDLNIQDLTDMYEDMTGMAEDMIDNIQDSIPDFEDISNNPYVSNPNIGMVEGTAEDDNLTGTMLSGLEGNDTLVGIGAVNMLNGDEGKDLLRGVGSINMLTGGAGNDNIYAQGAMNMISSGEDGNDNDTIWLEGNVSQVELIAGSGHDVINNFRLGSTTLFVEDIDQLSFVGSAEGTHIMQGDDLLAVAAGQSSDVFTQNTDAIFESTESFSL